MSLFDAYDPAPDAVLNPEDATRPIPGFPETVVITFQPSLVEAVAARPEAALLCRIPVFFQMPVYRLPAQGTELAVYQTLMGGAVSAAMLEEVIARGARKVVLFGSCGSLCRELPDGHLIVPTAAYRDEGVSYHYLPAEDYISLPTAPRTAEILRELGVPFAQDLDHRRPLPGDPPERGPAEGGGLHRGGHGVRLPCGGVPVPGRCLSPVPLYGGQSGRSILGPPPDGKAPPGRKRGLFQDRAGDCQTHMNHTHRPCRWFAQDRLGHDPGRANRLIEWSANRADFPGLPRP